MQETTDYAPPKLTPELIDKYNTRIPRYTSYPTVPNWDSKEFGPQQYLKHLKQASTKDEPLSIYIHIPFCIRRCKYCACNVLITQREDRTNRYLQYLMKEIKETAHLLEDRNEVIQFHLGGGTPTHLKPHQLDTLLSHVEKYFSITADAEQSIEIHPSVTSDKHIDVLHDHNFNRVSMGVQDFDPKVQENLNRYQTYEETVDLIQYCRDNGFESVNVDLIYGLPYQTRNGFADTIRKILIIRPDRIAMYSYAHFPSRFPHQASIPLEVIPEAHPKMQLFLSARQQLLEAGYNQIGFDHFALSTDELWKSYTNETLRRNFMGYTTKARTDLVAFGYSSISEFDSIYAQNTKSMEEYEQLIDKYGTATVRGHLMSEEDKIRKQIIMQIMCQGRINAEEIPLCTDETVKNIEQQAIDVINEFEDVDFVRQDNDIWQLTPLGSIFSRVIASKFDAYLNPGDQMFSKSI